MPEGVVKLSVYHEQMSDKGDDVVVEYELVPTYICVRKGMHLPQEELSGDGNFFVGHFTTIFDAEELLTDCFTRPYRLTFPDGNTINSQAEYFEDQNG